MNFTTRTPIALRLNAFAAAAMVTLTLLAGIGSLSHADSAPLMAAHVTQDTLA